MCCVPQVHCADVTGGGLLPDARCDHLSRPVSEEFCEAGACVRDTWLVGEWGPVRQSSHDMTHDTHMTLLQCSARCGHGRVTRRVTCLGQCDMEARPHSSEACRAPGHCQVSDENT